MATLFNTKISATYPGLIKTIDNTALSATLKQLTDGSGTASGVFMNTAGDFKVNSILEFGSLKDTGENIIITKFVDAADGIDNNNNDTSIPTSSAVKTYVDAVVTASDLDFLGDSNTGTPAVDLDSQNFSVLGTANEIVTSGANQILTIGLPNNVTISGTFTGATFAGQLNGTISSSTTATTQTAGDNSTKIATTAYVDTLDAASDLDFSGDSGTGDVNLNTQSLAITGTTNQIVTAASNQALSLSLPITIHRNLQGNVTGNVDGDLTGNVTATSVLVDGVTATTQASSDSSTKVATTAYVKGLDNASDLDITGDTGTGDVNLNTQTLNILGTTNEITTAVVNQTATISLPSTISVNVIGNVTGDLTGNADTATKWQTARDLSLTGQATGTLSNVDGTLAVSGAVTLDNNSVTGKVLTGLASPSASSVLATDSILEAFGKVQSQVNGLANGLRFIGSWDASSNSPVLSSGGGEAANGTTTSTLSNKLVDSSASFTSTVTIGDQVVNQVDGQIALVTNIDSNTTLSLDADIMLTSEAYTIDNSPFITQGHYYVVSVGGARTLNGINTWSVGDWVIAGANNEWTKLDHSQVDGTGTTGNIPKWSSTSVIADSIMAESGSVITVSGTLSTTTNLNSGSNFAVATDKFTANATTGNVAFPGDLAINTNKFTVNATSGNTLVAGTLNSGAITSTADAIFGGTSFDDPNSYGRKIEIADNDAVGLILNDTRDSNPMSIDNSGAVMNLRYNTTSMLALDGATSNATFAGNVGIGLTDTSSVKLGVSGNSGLPATSGTTQTGLLRLKASNNATLDMGCDHTTAQGWLQVTDVSSLSTEYNLLLQPNGGNVGIGGTPSTKIDVYQSTVGIGAADFRHVNGNRILINPSYNYYDAYNHIFRGLNGTDTHMTIDNSGNSTFSGNVGVGMTPDTSWGTNSHIINLGIGNADAGHIGWREKSGADELSVGWNVYHNNTNWYYASNNPANLYTQDNGTHKFQVAANGTADNVITWTDGLTIDSSGVISIGTRKAATPSFMGYSSSYKTLILGSTGTDYTTDAVTLAFGVDVSANANGSFTGNGREYIWRNEGSFITPNAANNSYQSILNWTSGGYTHFASRVGVRTNSPLADLDLGTTGGQKFYVYADGDIRAGMGIDLSGSARELSMFCTSSDGFSNGNLSFGYRLESNGAYQERMRLTSAGFLGLGIQAPVAQFHLRGSGSYNSSPTETIASDAIITSSEMTDTAYHSILQLVSVRQSLTTGSTAQGFLGFSTVDDSNGAGVRDAARIAIINEQTSTVHSATALSFWTNTGGSATNAPTEKMRITSGGDIEIPTNEASIRLISSGSSSYTSINRDASNNLNVRNTANNNIFSLENGGNLTIAGTLTQGSDKSLKENIKPLETQLDIVNKLNPVSYNRIGQEENEIGFIAQEVQELIPDLVFENPDGLKSLAYANMTSILVKAIQELTAKVEKLEQECKCKN